MTKFYQTDTLNKMKFSIQNYYWGPCSGGNQNFNAIEKKRKRKKTAGILRQLYHLHYSEMVDSSLCLSPFHL